MSIHNNELLNTTGIQIKKDACVVIVGTEWNSEVIDELIRGAQKVLDAQQVKYSVIKVPGAVELPFAIQQYYQRNLGTEKQADAFIAMACVLRGDTPHFDYVCQSVTQGITQLNLTQTVPTIFGVLTVNTPEQITERLGGKHGHKGEEAAITALKMISLSSQL